MGTRGRCFGSVLYYRAKAPLIQNLRIRWVLVAQYTILEAVVMFVYGNYAV